MNRKRRVTLYNILAAVFLGLQIISYLGNAASNKNLPEEAAERMGYYIGSSVFAIISLIFFISAAQLRKKIKKAEGDDTIDSIGKEV